MPEKCFLYLVELKWDSNGQAKMRKQHALDDLLLLHAGHGFIPQEVPRKEINEGHHTLEIQLDPSISLQDETKYLQQVADKISGKLCRKVLNKTETRVSYHTMYMPKIGYGASVVSLSKR